MADEKVSKASVNYRDQSEEKHCCDCSMYRDQTCTLVEGWISPVGTCDEWDPKKVSAAEDKRSIMIVRHGATSLNNDDNSVDRIRGWVDIPLSEEGQKEVKHLAEEMTQDKPDVIVTSNLKRALQTAEAISVSTGVPVSEESHAFRPWNAGDYAGRKSSEAVPEMAKYAHDYPDKPLPNGESFNDFKARFLAGLCDALDKYEGVIAVVTHHRNDRLLHAWQTAGFPDDGEIDKQTFCEKGERTASVSTMEIPMDRLRAATKERAKRHSMSAVSMQARSLNLLLNDHINKMPFSGVLTKIDQPSDEAPQGSGGKRVMITAEAARNAVDSLLGMAVDFTPDWDGHDPQAKIGVITSAYVAGSDIIIEGFIYAADFPEVAKDIKANKDRLGFSFEARNLMTTDPDADPLPIVECVFTGAAILFKDKAAYKTTSITARADSNKDLEMTKEELSALLAEALKPLHDTVKEQADKIASLEKVSEKVEAASTCMAAVEPHAARMDEHAEKMEKAGVGMHPMRGHVAFLRRMAGSMRADAAMGKVPHIFEDTGWLGATADKADKDAVKEAVAKVSADLAKQLEDLKAASEKTEAAHKDEVASLNTKLEDMKLQAEKAQTEKAAERKTLPSRVTALLAKTGIEVPTKEGEKIAISVLDKALATAAIPAEKRVEIKTALAKVGLVD